jgi:hypothetical protein
VNRHDIVSQSDAALPVSRQVAPALGAVLAEIGFVIALHLTFALAVLLTLDAFGVR